MFMKITLINAQIREANNLVPPIGILSLASVLEREGFEVQLIDDDFFVNDFTSDVTKFQPDLIGISFFTPSYSRAKQIATSLKKALPHVIFCAGGFHTSVFPIQVLQEFNLDFCVVGEGEVTLLEVCQKISDCANFSDVHGICCNINGVATINSSRPLIENLDTLPFPAIHLLDFERYLRPPGLFRGQAMSRVTVIATSRGCPYRCSYCGGRKLYNGTVRLRSVESIKDELQVLIDKLQVNGIWIIDECFSLDRARTRAIAEVFATSGIKWGIQTRVDLVDYELILHFKQCGCIEINFGVESGSDRILGILKKGTTTQRALDVFAWCHDIAMKTTANFMLGSPTETEVDCYRTFEFSKKLHASFTVFHITTPFPGTELYDIALREGLLKAPVDFDETWMHRASDISHMRTELSSEKLLKIRARFQNYYFVRNYLGWLNICWGIYFLFRMFFSPSVVYRSFQAFRRHGRIDSFIEHMVASVNK